MTRKEYMYVLRASKRTRDLRAIFIAQDYKEGLSIEAIRRLHSFRFDTDVYHELNRAAKLGVEVISIPEHYKREMAFKAA